MPATQQPKLAIAVSLTEVRDIEALGVIWRDLESRAIAHFFLSWCWIGTWLRCIERPVHCLRAEADGRVVGLALLCEHAELRHKLFPVRSLCLNTTGVDDCDVVTIEYNGFLVEHERAEQINNAMLEYLLSYPGIGGRCWNELQIKGATRAFSEHLVRRSTLRHEIAAESPSAYVDLQRIRASGKSFLDHLSSNTRSQIRRSMRLYTARGALQLEAATDTVQALEYFEHACTWHQQRWQARGQRGALDNRFFIDFNRRMIMTNLLDGHVELLRVSAGDEPIGYLYNFLYRGQVYYYFSGLLFEPDNRLKPGLVCHTLCIEHHLRLGDRIYDFMAGENRYKSSLGQPGADMLALRLQRPGLTTTTIALLKKLKHRLSL